MPIPSRSIRFPLQHQIYTIFGAGTNVGKTIISTLLTKTFQHAAHASRPIAPVRYLKPVQTGSTSDADHVNKFASVQADTIWTFDLPASPDIAAEKEGIHINDDNFRKSIDLWLREHVGSLPAGPIFIETAGGVNSPGISGNPQSSIYRPYRFPIFLVGDPQLGGINATLSAYEVLKGRGYDVHGIGMLDTNWGEQNATRLERMVRQLQGNRADDTPVWLLPSPPEKVKDLVEDEARMTEYYSKASQSNVLNNIVSDLNSKHANRAAKIHEMKTNAGNVVWWPFTQHADVPADGTAVIDSAHGDNLVIADTIANDSKVSNEPDKENAMSSKHHGLALRNSYDAAAAWWTSTFGHGSYLPSLNASIQYASSRYGHLLFPEHIHEPAYDLTTRLLRTAGHPWASRVFLTDDGSTAVEVGLKMALRLFKVRNGLGDKNDPKGVNVGIVGIDGGYHGDTIGAQDASPKSVFNANVDWHTGRGIWLTAPSVQLHDRQYWITWNVNGETRHVNTGTDDLQQVLNSGRGKSDGLRRGFQKEYQNYINDCLARAQDQSGYVPGVLIIEPMMMAAGGMVMTDPLFQHDLIKAAHEKHMSLLFDEVFSGTYRLGPISFSSFFTPYTPHVSCLGKSVTGGMVPLGITMATEEVFKCYEGGGKERALLHGHSYSAYPVGCAAAVTALEECEARFGHDKQINTGDIKTMSTANHSVNQSVKANGSIGNPWLDDPDCKESIMLMSELSNVKGVTCIGTVFAVELATSQTGFGSKVPPEIIQFLRAWDVQVRPLGNTVYIISSFSTPADKLRELAEKMYTVIRDHK